MNFNQWLDQYNTTNGRILMSTLLFAIYILVILAALLCGKPLQLEIVASIGISILTMAGVDVVQFVKKRKTDYGYIERMGDAKQQEAAASPSVVNVGGPSQVSVTQEGEG